LNDSRRLKASDLHDAARERLDGELSKYGFSPAGGYTEGSNASHLYRGGDRFLIFRLDDQGSGEGGVELGLAADDAPISGDHSMSLAELTQLKGLGTPRFALGDAWEFAESGLESLGWYAMEFLEGDVRSFVHDHIEVVKRRDRQKSEGFTVAWPTSSLAPDFSL
jgi:hypothetical protein